MEILSSVTLFFISLTISPCSSCILLLNGWKPMSVKERAQLADVVVAAHAIKTFKNHRTKSDTYSALFRLDNVIKGNKILDKISPALNNHRPSYNISNFGDKAMCYADIEAGEKYILFLTTFKNRLSAKYDDIFGAAAPYTIDDEEELYKDLGWNAWSDWSACDKQCNAGTQIRQRRCMSSEHCVQEKQPQRKRQCNLFPCKGFHDFIAALGFQFLPKGVTKTPDRKTAFSISSDTKLFVPLANFIKPKFPLDFSILLTIRLESAARGGFIFGITDMKGRLKLGVSIGAAAIRLDYSDFAGKPGASLSPSFSVSLTEGRWYHLAFSIEGTFVSLFVDCVVVGREKLNRVGGFDHRQTILSVPVPFGRKPKSAFQGDIEQLAVVENPKAAELQCGKVREKGDEIKTVDENKMTDSMRGDERDSLETTTTIATHRANCYCMNGYCDSMGVCHCSVGYTGKTCGEAICCPSCQNDGRCVHPNVCQCKRGTYGKTCQNIYCQRPCLNGGRCAMFNRCICPPGYYGHQCQMRGGGPRGERDDDVDISESKEVFRDIVPRAYPREATLYRTADRDLCSSLRDNITPDKN
ncbi:uncharacterized protein LOC141907227 [Tubulanus polymorphus]|uniref:uncharacterized protein LOC141907227 n=1 Tax=Tubulanus polymorphus TaxID=672921 RepID=UPI003DA2848A